MLQLPRALILDAERAFADVIKCSLRERSREVAIRIESSLQEADCALEEYRPHIVFLSWALGTARRSASTLLRKLADLMAAEPNSYEYPLVVSTDWRPEFEEDWDELGVTFHLDNPKVLIHKSDWVHKGPIVIDEFLKKVEPRRILRLEKASVVLSRCAYLRISDGPPRLHYGIPDSNKEISLPRHRLDTFELIAKQLVPDELQAKGIRYIPSLFVRANRRNCWVNLAHVRRISFDEDGERSFVFGDAAHQQFRLAGSVAAGVSAHLEGLKHMKYWDHLNDITVPG